MRPDDFDVGPRDREHVDLIDGAGDELGEAAGEGDFAARGQPARDREHILLGDLAFEEAVRMELGKTVGVCRIAHVAVDRNDAIIDVAERDQGDSVPGARREALLL